MADSDVAARMEDYAWLLSQGETRQGAARRLGVTMRTIERYEARLRRAAGERKET